MGVFAYEEGAVRSLCTPVITDRLCDGKDMRLGEGATQRGTPVSAGAEADRLRGVVYIGSPLVVLRSSRARSTSISLGAALPASGEISEPDIRSPPNICYLFRNSAVSRKLYGTGHVRPWPSLGLRTEHRLGILGPYEFNRKGLSLEGLKVSSLQPV